MKIVFSVIVFIFYLGVLLGQNQHDKIQINDDLYLVRLTDNSWIHVSYLNGFKCNGLILADNNNAILFDTPSYDSVTVELTSYIQDKMGLEIVGFITNDWHIDSQGGLDVIHKLKIPSYSNEMTRDIAKQKELPFTSIGFQDSLKINFENISVELYYFGAAHTMDNIVAWIPSEQILFASCMVKELSQNNLGFTGDGDLNEYPKTLKRISDKFNNAKYVIPGHGKFGGYDLIKHTLEVSLKYSE